MYTHLTRDDRVALAALLRAGHSQADAARAIGKHPSTVSRELRRNEKNDGGYHATHADVLARERRGWSKVNTRKIENNRQLADLVEALLDPLVSPEVIAHLLDLSPETIYAWVARSRPELLCRLPQRGRKRRRYGSKRAVKQGWTKYVRSIDKRPLVASASFEGDTVTGRGRARLLTHVERTSLFAIVDRIQNGTADVVHATLKARTAFAGAQITYDRGSEFALWRMIEQDTESSVYFANAHHPWERGKNENTNGRLRRVFPKGTDFATLRARELSEVVALMNHTPRKSLDWQTPCRVYGKCCGSD